AWKAPRGAPARPGWPLWEVTDTARQVTIDLDASRRPSVRVRDRADRELPGGRTTTGRVRSVGRVATVPSGGDGGDGTPTVELVVSLDDPKATGRLDQAPVTASITTEVRKGVLAVPVNALLALAEGGYAVEVERDGHRQLFGVRTGPFAGGQGEVTRGGRPAGGRPGGGAGMSPEGAPALELRGVVKRYPGPPEVEVLAGVSLTVGPGELLAIAGPSGSGKSTLLHVMGTLDRPTAGTVLVAGQEVGRLSDRALSAFR